MGALIHRRAGSRRAAVGLLAVMVAGCGGGARVHSDPFLAYARRQVGLAIHSDAGYQGPRSGPRARRARLIVFVAADVTNGGIAGAAAGVEQAAANIGWPLRVIDGQASVAGRAAAMRTALALRPSGIIIGGFDPGEQAPLVREAVARHIPIVGWHAGPRPGPDPAAGLFTNVTTDPIAVARLAALYAIATSGGRAGVAIFYDSSFAIAVEKAAVMRTVIARCRACRLLAMIDLPIAQAQIRSPAVLTELMQRFGSQVTDLLAINGNYFAGTRAALFDLGRSGTQPPYGIAAGDGDASEFERIRSGDYQRASVAEPLFLQGWQLIDELNRALAGDPPSGYLAPPRLIVPSDVPAGPVFDPDTGYRSDYRRIWGV